MLRSALDWLWGYDFFVSYGHGDGTLEEIGGVRRSRYVAVLVRRLRQAKFSVFHDETEFDLGDELNAMTARRVRASTKLVVVARRAAMESKWVLKEVQEAILAGNDVIVIDINGTFTATAADNPVRRAIGDSRLRFSESLADADGNPSDPLIERLCDSSQRSRRDRRRRNSIRAVAVVLGILLVVAIWQWRLAVQQRNLALSQRLAIAAPDIGTVFREDDVAALVALQALHYHERSGAKSLALIDNALRSVLSRDWFCRALPRVNEPIVAMAWNPKVFQLAAVTAHGRLVIHPLEKPATTSFDVSAHAFTPLRSDSPLTADLVAKIDAALESYPELKEHASMLHAGGEVEVEAGTSLWYDASGTSVICAYPGSVKAWDVASRKERQLPAEIAHARLAAFDSQSQTLVTVAEDQLAVWTLSKEKPTRQAATRIEKGSSLVGLTISRAGKRIAAIQSSGGVILWKNDHGLSVDRMLQSPPQTGLGQFVDTFNYRGELARFTSEGKTLVTTDVAGVYVWDLEQAEQPPRQLPVTMPLVVSISSNDQQLLVASVQARFAEQLDRVFSPGVPDNRSGFVVCSLQDLQLKPEPMMGEEMDVLAIAHSPNGKWLATGNSLGGIRIWDLDQQRPRTALYSVSQDNLSDVPAAGGLAFLGSDESLLVSDYHRTVIVGLKPRTHVEKCLVHWADGRIDFAQGDSASHAIYPMLSTVKAVAVNEVGSVIAFGRTSAPSGLCGLVQRKYSHLVSPNVQIISIDLDRAGTCLAMVDSHHVLRIWRDQRSPAQEVKGDDAWVAVALARDGSKAVTAASGGAVAVWDLIAKDLRPQSLRQPSELGATGIKDGSNAGLCVAISPDGRRIAAGGRGNAICVWDLNRPDELPHQLTGHNDAVTCICFHPARAELVSGGRDGRVLLWSLDLEFNGGLELGAHELGVAKLAISPSGRFVASLGADGIVGLSVSRTSELSEIATRSIWRNLTPAEWNQYIGSEFTYELTVPHPSPPQNDCSASTYEK